MSETPWTRLESLPPEIGLLVNEICMRFESVWRQGRWPRIEEYLGDAPEPARPVLLRELVLLDVEYRRQKGEAPSADDYRRLFLSGAPGWLARELADLSDRDDWPRIPGYEVLGRLGAGGMGVVYKARQFAPNRLVALKRMKPTDPQHEAEARQRFRLEAEAAARLRHPGIVEIYEVGEHDGCPYFSMELIENGSLDARLKSGPLPPRQAAEVVEKVARAVQAAHQAGIVHRDLKPANVLLAEVGGEATPTVAGHLPTQEGASAPVTSRSFEPRITDFGLARKLDAEGPSQTGALLGTPQYMAPEQVRGEKMITAAADVYSLGVVLYECLTGRPPFAAPTPVDLFVAVLNDEPVPVRRLQPRVERDLETICHRCLRKEPGKRYGSALEVAEDLRRLQEGRPIEARPVGAIERGAKWVRRNPVVAALAAAILLVVATGATVATVFGVMEKQARGRAELEAGEKGKALGKAQENEQKAKAASDKAKERAEEAEMGRHGFMMTAAWQAWQQNDLRMAEAILREVPEKLRQTWEFRHVRGLCQRKAMTLRGHTDGVNGVAYSPDGSRLASAGDDRTLKVWDAKTGQHLLTLEGHTNSVRAVAYGPDGTRIASGDRGDGTLKVWDASTGKHLLTLEGHTECVWSVAFSPDGTRIASASQDKTLKVWDARTGKVLLTLRGHTGSVTAVAFSPDGKRIASASLDKTLKVWDARTGKVLLTLKGSALAVAYSPDGKRIASGTRDWTLKVWDAATGQNLLTLKGHTNSVSAVAYSPDGTRLASGSLDGAVKVWDARTGQEVLTFKGHSGSVTAVAYSPDGSRIASGSSDKTLKVWDASTSQDLLTLEGHRGSVTAVAYSPDGSRIASGGLDRGLKVWDARTWRSLLTLEGHRGTVTAMAYSPDGTRIASASQDKTLKVWDARTGRELFTLEGHTKEVFAVAYSPDGSRIASGSLDGKLKVWDAKTGHDLLTLEGHMDGVTAVAYSPDGSRIASASQDKTLKVWDARTGKALLTLRGHANSVTAVAYSPDGKCIFGEDVNGKVFAWDVTDGKPLPDAPSTMPTPSRLSVAHGDRRAYTEGNLVRIERLLSADEWSHWHLDEGRIEAELRASRDRESHASEAERMKWIDPFGATFHLDRLLALSPDERPRLIRQRTDVLASVLRNGGDPWATREIARHLIGDPGSVSNPAYRRYLLGRLAVQQRAPLDRLYGVLLLRTGNAQDAALVFRAAIRNRAHDQPPIDELLLALALLDLDRRDEARQYLKTAADWMDNGTASLRLTAILGSRPAGPLAALAAVAHVPDVRLNPLDPFTAHELYTLRREAERALAE